MNKIALIIFIGLMISIVLFFINIFFINKPVYDDQQSTDRIKNINDTLTITLGTNWIYTLLFISVLLIIIFYLLYLVSVENNISFCGNKDMKIFMCIFAVFIILFLINLILVSIKVLQTQKFNNQHCVCDTTTDKTKLEGNDILKIVGLISIILIILGITVFIILKYIKPKPKPT
jgi:hypothetical protein